MGLYEELTGGHESPLALMLHVSFVLPTRLVVRAVRWHRRRSCDRRLRKAGWHCE